MKTKDSSLAGDSETAGLKTKKGFSRISNIPKKPEFRIRSET